MKKPFRRNAAPQEISAVLAKALGRTGLDKEINRYRFVLHWKEIVGEDIARFARPEAFKDGSLIITVMTSAWAQELSFHRETILTRLRKFAGDELSVKDLIFQVNDHAFR
jgi:predicted nucleic acid-binding Zn ribbon protein